MTAFLVFNQWTPVEGCSAAAEEEDALTVPISEAVSVTSVNVLAPLSHTPVPNPITIAVNGRAFFNVGSPPDFSVSGSAITWLSTEYSVSPGDDVVAIYFYIG